MFVVRGGGLVLALRRREGGRSRAPRGRGDGARALGGSRGANDTVRRATPGPARARSGASEPVVSPSRSWIASTRSVAKSRDEDAPVLRAWTFLAAGSAGERGGGATRKEVSLRISRSLRSDASLSPARLAPRARGERQSRSSDATRDSTRAVAEWLERARGDSLAATATFMERDMQAILTFGWV